MQNLKTRKLNRLKNYDYSDNGYYFTTVCSKNREIIFGKYNENLVGTALAAVRYKNNIKLSKLGQIINNQWNDIPNQYNNVELDQYVIMPNHIHGVIIINEKSVETGPDKIGIFNRWAVSIFQILAKFK